MITVYNWSILVQLSGGGDIVRPYGRVDGHDSIPNGTHGWPSRMVDFNKQSGEGLSVSGKKYMFDKDSFIPNDNAKTYEEAVKYITKFEVI